MKKRVAIVFVLLVIAVTLVGCEKLYTPDPAVEQYFQDGLTASSAFNQIATASYVTTITVQDKQGNELGVNVQEVFFDKTDANNLVYTIHQTYTGGYVEDNVTEMDASIQKTDDRYFYTVVKYYSDTDTPTTSTNQIEDKVALDLITALVYKNNGVYDEGGLYYGDYFARGIYRYPADLFYVDTEANLCVFDAHLLLDQGKTGQVMATQLIKINQLGLLVYFYEKYESVKSDRIMISETIPQYEYVITAE